jgi:hypothetical protein
MFMELWEEKFRRRENVSVRICGLLDVLSIRRCVDVLF